MLQIALQYTLPRMKQATNEVSLDLPLFVWYFELFIIVILNYLKTNTMKKLLLVLLFFPLVSFGQSAHQNMALKLKAGVYYDSGISRINLEDYYGAVADFTKAIELNPDLAEAYYNRGISKYYLEDYYGAIADYTKAIERNFHQLDPDITAYNNRGAAKDDLKDYYGAIADYTKAIELNPDDPEYYYNRGRTKKSLEDYYGAVADFTKAIELNPDFAKAYYNRGLAKYYLNDLNGACLDVRKSVNLGYTDSQDFMGKVGCKKIG